METKGWLALGALGALVVANNPGLQDWLGRLAYSLQQVKLEEPQVLAIEAKPPPIRKPLEEIFNPFTLALLVEQQTLSAPVEYIPEVDPLDLL